MTNEAGDRQKLNEESTLALIETYLAKHDELGRKVGVLWAINDGVISAEQAIARGLIKPEDI